MHSHIKTCIMFSSIKVGLAVSNGVLRHNQTLVPILYLYILQQYKAPILLATLCAPFCLSYAIPINDIQVLL